MSADDPIRAAVLTADPLDRAEALLAVLHHLDTYAVRIVRTGDPMVVAADIRDLIAKKIGINRPEFAELAESHDEWPDGHVDAEG